LECLRTLDRLRLSHGLSGDDLGIRREAVSRLIGELVLVHDAVLGAGARACGLSVVGL